MIKNGRQMSATLEGIRDDHRARYNLAADQILESMGDGADVLDVGCGCGYGAHILANTGLSVHACDIDAGAVEYAREHYGRGVVFFQASLAAIRADMVRGKAITAFEVIEHTPDAVLFLRRAARVARLLIGSVPNELVVPFGPGVHSQHYRHYTSDQIALELIECGWKPTFIGSQVGKRSENAAITTNARAGRTIVFVAEPA